MARSAVRRIAMRSTRLCKNIHRLDATAAGVLRPPRYDYAQPRRDLIEPFGHILTDVVQSTTAARTGLGLGFDDDLLARRMGRKMTAIGAASFRALSPDDAVGLFRSGIPSAAASPMPFCVSTSSWASSICSSLMRSERRPNCVRCLGMGVLLESPAEINRF